MGIFYKYFLIFLFFSGITGNTILCGQELEVKIIAIDTFSSDVSLAIQEWPNKADSLQVGAYIDSLLMMLRNIGYLSSGIDTIVFKDTIVNMYLYAGPTYWLKDIAIATSNKVILQGSGINYLDFSDQVLTQKVYENFKFKLLDHLANVGYPFAAVSLDSIRIKDHDINSSLKIDKNQLIVYDTIMVTGNANVNKSYLHKYLNIRKGNPYRQSDILNIKRKIQDLQFIDFKADPSVTFVNGKAYFDFPLVNNNASRFDFIIGVLPRSENGIRKWTITGDFTGEFVNKLGDGESIALKYKKLRPETQELEAEINYPYLFNIPFGIDAHFELYKSTSDFLDLRSGLGISYNLSRRDYLKIGWNFNSSRLIEIDTLSILRLGKLPQQLDVNVTAGRVSLIVDRLDYKYNPRSGFLLNVQTEAGQKKIIPNLTITSLSDDNLDFETAYDTLQLNTFQSQLFLDLDYFINVKNWSTIRIASRSAYKYNQKKVYLNEYFRIGGNKLLRGFNEESILTPAYSIFTAEFRLILDQQSFLSLPFIDYGVIRIGDEGQMKWDTAIGVGIGLNFATKAGIFNIAFATGSAMGSGFNFGDTKIHFGFVNLF